MGSNYGRPVTVSSADGSKNVDFNAAQGLVIRESGTQVLLVGYGQDGSLGFSFSDESNERIFIGRNTDGDLTFKFSKTGFDAKAATTDQLIMSSEFSMLKVIDSDTLTLNRPAATSSVQVDVATSLAGSAFFAWATVTNASPNLTRQVPFLIPDATGANILWEVTALYDSTVGVIRFFHNAYNAAVIASAFDLSIKYIIMDETLV